MSAAKPYILGIDPGLSGALALFHPIDTVAGIFDMPTLELKQGKSIKRHLDLYALARWFDINACSVRLAVIEDPHSMPEQGVASAFKFGHVCGVVQAMVAAHLIPMALVRPAVWKQRVGVTADKDSSRHKASQILPTFSHLWARKKDDGRAEAVLLALYGARLQ